jgi:3'(2'), 5'-bisphosphate nucleotidase
MAAHPADHTDAAALAASAGDLLLELRRGIPDLYSAADAKDLGDRRANDHLMTRLAELHPDDAILSEEAADDPARLGADRVWIIDPLDGTREFGEPPRIDWAVHVALVIGGEPVVGAVALPAQHKVLSTAGIALAPKPPPTIRMTVSRSRPPAWTQAFADRLGAELVPMGSAGAKIAAVIQGEADLYVHDGGQYEWDSAAPIAVARAAGLHTSRIDGSPLRYNRPDPWLPDLVVCHPDLVARVFDALSQR